MLEKIQQQKGEVEVSDPKLAELKSDEAIHYNTLHDAMYGNPPTTDSVIDDLRARYYAVRKEREDYEEALKNK